MRNATEAQRTRKRHVTRHRRRARKGAGKTYNGVTDEQIYARDSWTCQMPVCLCPAGRAIDPAITRPDQWSRSINHIIPLPRGTDAQDNKRAAHLRCNMAAAKQARAARSTEEICPDRPKVAAGRLAGLTVSTLRSAATSLNLLARRLDP